MKFTPELIRTRKAQGIVALTAYDYPTARLLDEAGVEIILVGDSLGMVIFGSPDTTTVTLAEIIHHTRAVRRGTNRALLVADLPIHTYDSPDEAIDNAKRLVDEGADAVKLEGGAKRSGAIAAIVHSGIPVMGHLGMLPQSIREEGAYRIKGKSTEDREFLLKEAETVELAGAFAVVLELIFPPTSREITARLKIPTIGIGSGPDCDGQIQVFHDLMGYSPWFVPKHVRVEAAVAQAIQAGVRKYVERVKNRPTP